MTAVDASQIDELRAQVLVEMLTREDTDAAGPDDQPYPVPSEQSFGAAEFAPAPALRELVEQLIERHAERFEYLDGLTYDVLWRAKGGTSNGRPTLGKCQKPAGLLRHYSAAALVLWVAADHARQLRLTHHQIEAELYHELCHTEQDEKTGQLVLVGHEFEGFTAELEHYGPWRASLEEVVKTVQQLQMEIRWSRRERGVLEVLDPGTGEWIQLDAQQAPRWMVQRAFAAKAAAKAKQRDQQRSRAQERPPEGDAG